MNHVNESSSAHRSIGWMNLRTRKLSLLALFQGDWDAEKQVE